MNKERVQKFISISGYCSRRKAEELIKEKRVKVNGEIIEIGGQCFPTDKITIDNKEISFSLDKKKYIILNKPKGYVCSREDKFNSKTIFDIILKNDFENNLFSIGRLDKDTEGLIIITNDGGMNQRIIHPSKKIEKEYILKLNKKLNDVDKKSIESGLVLEGYKLSRCKITEIKNNIYSIIINEGRKRQIRNVFSMKKYRVEDLKRVRIGNLRLNEKEIKTGKYKIVNKEFINKVFT